ncbi:MAG: acyloxyacyl hydrolase [Rickettsiales bacterium]|jgi:hypothetical protein|nr:acyloxyacyl hydrolase [Rickettsiales bacterium]
MLKKIAIIFTGLFIVAAGAGAAESTKKKNPFFGDYENQIMINLGQGVNSFALVAPPSDFVPFNMIEFQYSQPNTFFRLPGRQNLRLIKTFGYGKKYWYTDYEHTYEWNWTEYSTEMAIISEDVTLYSGEHFYFGAGAGAGVQGRQNERMGTKFLLAFKLFAGYRVSDRWSIELFDQHYSNGDTGGVANYSYNFWGLGAGYNF